MNNSPAFQFYPKDFLADQNVTEMNMRERGIYITLLCHCWIEGCLDGGSRVVDKWFKQAPTVAKCFYEKDGNFHHKRLDEERQKQKRWSEKSKAGGLHSAETKRLSKGGSRMVQPKVNSSSSSSSSSSISLNKNLKSNGQTEFDPLFEEFWKVYPKKIAKGVAREKFLVLAKAGKIPELIKATHGYLDFLKHQRITKNFDQEAMHPATFLFKDRWRDYIEFKYEAPL